MIYDSEAALGRSEDRQVVGRLYSMHTLWFTR